MHTYGFPHKHDWKLCFSLCISMEIHMNYVFPVGNAYKNMELHMIFAVVYECA